MHVLCRFHEAVREDGLMLDLEVIRPRPVVEVDGTAVCAIEGEAILGPAEAAAATIDEMVAAGLLVEDAVDDHDVLKHYSTGAELVEDFTTKERNVPEEAIPLLERIDRACVVRERCRLRRLRVTRAP